MDTIVVILLTLAPCPCHRREAPKPRQEHKVDMEALRRAANEAAREADKKYRHVLDGILRGKEEE